MRRVNRRSLLGSGAGFAASSALVLAGCGDANEVESNVSGTVERDINLLNDALALELSAVAVYEEGAKQLDGEALEFAELFAEQEREHADKLEKLIDDLGGTPVTGSSPESYSRELGLDKLSSADEVLRFGVDLENSTIAAYNDAATKLSTPDLRRTAFSIVANEAQHLSALLGELGELQVPDAFVTGTQL